MLLDKINHLQQFLDRATPEKKSVTQLAAASSIHGPVNSTASKVLSIQQRKSRRNISNVTNTRTMNNHSASLGILKQQYQQARLERDSLSVL